MASHIPFISSPAALALVKNSYFDSEIVRVSLDMIVRGPSLPAGAKFWIDAGVDGLHALASRDTSSGWYKTIKQVVGYDVIATDSFVSKPDTNVLQNFVTSLMDLCFKHNPTWITVPQLPLVNDASRNRINRELAKATGSWKSSSKYSGRLILPVLFTSKKQLEGKTKRNPKVREAARCYDDSKADGFWVIDTKMIEEEGSVSLRNKQFKSIIALHEELNEKIPSTIRIAGPYWGLNLLLWARGLIEFPVIGVGSTYQYYLPGGHSNPAGRRVAISFLKRRVGVAQLSAWLTKSKKVLGSEHPGYDELEQISKQLMLLNDAEAARAQVAKFYKKWFDSISTTPSIGRPLSLFQDLSKAYVLGKSLPTLPEAGAARRPEAIAEPLMMNCL